MTKKQIKKQFNKIIKRSHAYLKNNKNTIKKIAIVVPASIALTLVLSSCGSKNAESSNVANSSSSITAPTILTKTAVAEKLNALTVKATNKYYAEEGSIEHPEEIVLRYIDFAKTENGTDKLIISYSENGLKDGIYFCGEIAVEKTIDNATNYEKFVTSYNTLNDKINSNQDITESLTDCSEKYQTLLAANNISDIKVLNTIDDGNSSSDELEQMSTSSANSLDIITKDIVNNYIDSSSEYTDSEKMKMKIAISSGEYIIKNTSFISTNTAGGRKGSTYTFYSNVIFNNHLIKVSKTIPSAEGVNNTNIVDHVASNIELLDNCKIESQKLTGVNNCLFEQEIYTKDNIDTSMIMTETNVNMSNKIITSAEEVNTTNTYTKEAVTDYFNDKDETAKKYQNTKIARYTYNTTIENNKDIERDL